MESGELPLLQQLLLVLLVQILQLELELELELGLEPNPPSAQPPLVQQHPHTLT